MKKSPKLFASLLVFVLTSGISQADITINPANSPYTLSGSIADNIVFDSGTANSSAATALNGALSGTGVVNKTGERTALLQLNGNNSAFSGSLNVSGNTWIAFLNSQSGSANAAWNLSMTGAGVGAGGSGLLLESTSLVGKTIELGDLSGIGLVRPGNMGTGTTTLKIGALGNNSTFSGIISNWSGISKVAVLKTGTGTWTLTGVNTFSEGLTISDGTVQLGNYNSADQSGGTSGSIASGITLNGGTFSVARNGNVSINQTVSVATGTLKSASASSAVTTFANIAMTGDGTLNVSTDSGNGSLVFSKLSVSQAGTQRLVKTGTGTLTLGDTQAYIGSFDLTTGTTIFSGTRSFDPSVAKKMGNISVTDGTLKIQASNPFGAGSYLPDLVALTNSTMINANGAGVNTNFGNIVLSNSTFQSGATATTTDARTILAGRITTLAGTDNFMTGRFVFRQDDYAVKSGGLVQSGVFDIQGDSKLTWSGDIQTVNGTQVIAKNGSGTMVFVGTTTQDASQFVSLVVNEGVFQIGNYSNNTSQDNTAFLLSNGLSQVTVGANGTLRLDISTQGAYEVGKTYVFNAGATLDVVNPNTVLTFRNNSVSGAITKTGKGYIAMGTDNVANLTSITIQDGYLKNWGTSRLGNGSVQIILDGGGFMEATSDVNIANPISVLSSGTITPESANTPFTLSGVISGAQGTTITKIGVANVTISNAENTFAGTWIIKEGFLTPGNVNAFKTATVQLDGGSLTLANSAVFKEINVTDNGGSIYASADVSPTGKLTGTGELVKTSNGRGSFLRMNNLDISEFAGTLTSKGSTWIHLNGKSGANITFNVENTDDSGFLLNGNAADYNFGNLTGTGWVRADQQNRTFNVTVGAKGEDGTFSGAFRSYQNMPLDKFNVTKTGAGTWTLASENQVTNVNYDNYQTSITIDEGTLELARKANQVSADSITINENGTLYLSTTGQKIINTLNNNGGEILVDLAAFDSEDYTPGIALLTTNGTVTGCLPEDFSFLYTDEIMRQTSFSFKTSDIISGLDLDISAQSLADQLEKLYTTESGIPLLGVTAGLDNSLLVSFNSAGVPEPSTWVLLILGSVGLVWFKRRKSA